MLANAEGSPLRLHSGRQLVSVDISLLAAAVYFSLAGAAMGCLTGAAPGIHVNTLCLLLVSMLGALLPLAEGAAQAFGTTPDNASALLACLIVSAAASHSFLDFIPTIFMGAPDEDDSLSVLPGHRLLLQGRGLEAVGQAAAGSLIGGAGAVLLCVPLYFVMGPPLLLYDTVDSLSLPMALLAVVLLLLSERGGEVTAEVKVSRVVRSAGPLSLSIPVPVHGLPVSLRGRAIRTHRGCWLVTPSGRWRLRGAAPEGPVAVEGTWDVRPRNLRNRSIALSLFLLSGLLGLVVMDRRLPCDDLAALDLSIMFPLLTGLFGMPSLIGSGNAPLPPQREDVGEPMTAPSILGALAGALVGWFPGISSTTGVIIASSITGRDGDAGRFIAMVSAVGTASAVFGLLALAVAFKGRSGALLAVKEVLGGDTLPFELFPLLLVSVLVGCAVGHRVLLCAGRRFALTAANMNVPRMNRIIMVLLIILTIVFNGVPGAFVLLVSTMLGMVPPAMGVGRVHLTGCLLLPVLLFLLGIRDAVSAAL